MSKSLQNTVDVDQFLEKYTANDFRFLCLLSRYRHNLEYDSDMMVKAVTLRKKFGTFLENAFDYVRTFQNQGNVDEVKLLKMLYETEKKVQSSLANDFNTVLAMAELTDLVTLTNFMIRAENNEAIAKKGSVAVAYVANYVKKTLSLLGVDYKADQVSSDSIHLTEEIISASVEFRSQIRNVAITAVKQKEVVAPKDQFKSLLQICDQFRDKLSTTGIVIKDHKDRSAWSFDTDNKS